MLFPWNEGITDQNSGIYVVSLGFGFLFVNIVFTLEFQREIDFLLKIYLIHLIYVFLT